MKSETFKRCVVEDPDETATAGREGVQPKGDSPTAEPHSDSVRDRLGFFSNV
jgi:hypothetical protein